MAIASMVCGIVGLLGTIIYGINFLFLYRNQMPALFTLIFMAYTLAILAFIFGKIERKKGKDYKNRGMATAGFALGLIGILLPIVPAFAITGTIVVHNAINKPERTQTVVPDNSPFIGAIPKYAIFSAIGKITAHTKDTIPHSVIVEMLIQYDLGDNTAQRELTERLDELRNFVRDFFSTKYAAELQPENEQQLKQEIIELLNTQMLKTAKARGILFKQLEAEEE